MKGRITLILKKLYRKLTDNEIKQSHSKPNQRLKTQAKKSTC